MFVDKEQCLSNLSSMNTKLPVKNNDKIIEIKYVAA